jgi:phage repressor protein C with HTH and peptisase S24 domain
MSWARFAIEELAQGNRATIRPRGRSMHPRVKDGDLVTVDPCKPEDLKVDDIVLVRVKGNVYLHLIKAVDGSRLLIGNNRGGINGWVGSQSVYGKAVRIE